MSAKADWNAVKAAYITSQKSYAQIAKDFGLSYNSVISRGKREGWVSLRKAFHEAAMMQAVAGEVANEADRLGNLIKAANAMRDVIWGVFGDEKQFHRHMITESAINDSGMMVSNTIEKVFAKVDTKAIRDMTAAMKDMTFVLRNLYNLPTQGEAEAQRIAAERLKIEQAKAANEDDGSKKVEFILGELEEFAK